MVYPAHLQAQAREMLNLPLQGLLAHHTALRTRVEQSFISIEGDAHKEQQRLRREADREAEG